MKPQTTLANKDKMLELICRKIWSSFHVTSDESWERTWEWHTDPEVIRKGGTWEIVRAAKEIMQLLGVRI